MARIRCAAPSVVACVVIAAVGAPAAAAKTLTLHFFAKEVYMRLRDTSGKLLPPTSAPTVGDGFSSASSFYAGNHRHHAKLASGSDHLACTLTKGSALCDGAIAIGSFDDRRR